MAGSYTGRASSQYEELYCGVFFTFIAWSVWQVKHQGTRGAFWFACWQIVAEYPGRANYSCPTYYANRESVPKTLDEAIFNLLRAKQSRNKCIVTKALWTELRSERTDMKLQHLFFDSTEKWIRQGYFQWIYSLRAAGTPEISVQPCLSFSRGNPPNDNSPKSR